MATRMLAVARDLDPKNAPKLAKLLEGTARTRPGGTGVTGAVAAISAGGRSAVVGGDTSVEGPSSSVDESMDASMDGQ